MNKFLNLIGFLSVVSFVCLLIYIGFAYPNAPIRPCGMEQYCDKQGHISSRVEYEFLTDLEYTIPALFIIGSGAFAIANRSLIWNTRK